MNKIKKLVEDRQPIKYYLSNYGIWLAAVILVAVFSIFSKNFLSAQNLVNLLRQTSIIGIVTMGTAMIIITGGIDLSSGSMVGFTACIAAQFALKSVDLLFVVPLIIGIAVGTGLGFANGFVIAKGKVPPFIVTLGMMSIARGAILVVNEGRPISHFTDSFNSIGATNLITIEMSNNVGAVISQPILPLITLIFIGIVTLTWYFLKYLKFGREVYAIGDNEGAAEVSGIKTIWTKIRVYTLAGAFTGLAGVLWASRMQAATSSAATGYELDAIAGAVVGGCSLSGGTGKVNGIILGIFVLSIITNGLDMLGVSPYYQAIIKGMVIVFAVWLDSRKTI